MGKRACGMWWEGNPRGRSLSLDLAPNPAATLWSAALGRLQVQTPKPTFDTWLAGSFGSSLDGGCLTVSMPSAFAADWVERQIQALVEAAVSTVANRALSVTYVVGNAPHLASSSQVGTDPGVRAPLREPAQGSPLRADFTFESYVVGASNQLAYAAAQAVARGPGTSYNPLYFYGPIGLGKTHLMHAIGRQALAAGRSALYITTEEFASAYLSALRRRRMEEFRDRFRAEGVLLVDDIQFLAGRPSAQHAFFDIFNALLAHGGQLVLSSDRPAGELKDLEPRLRSRFEGGLQADISPPDYDTRLALLESFSSRAGVAIPPAGLEFIARRITESARPLLGCVTRLAALAEFTQQAITLELVHETVGLQPSQGGEPTPDAILQAVALSRNVPVSALIGRTRNPQAASARQLSMHLLHTLLGLSPQAVGTLVGNRDHKTVRYSLRRAAEAIQANPALAVEADAITFSVASPSNATVLSRPA